MFFKRIEFVGFKSFATKTSVDLIPGVTVVVGPNGCGKSNILDAIKWVLGDQSPRSMRGKQMQDVIFAGSASFKPLGMAQVTLTMDNSARTLDMDFEEIQVTRRLFRTGESEYLLNKVPCRLRDLHNLFLGTGIGMSAYSILEQGRVDRIINAKPLDRRGLIEEAAGISKYKIRKIEALRKLERTAEDLKRLNDLVFEVERQVASLKRQASKAERYRELSAELRKAELQLLVLRSSALRTELSALLAEMMQTQDRLGTLRAEHARLSAEDEKGREQLGEVDTKLSEKNQQLFEIKTSVQEHEHLAQRHADRIKASAQRRQQIEGELSEVAAREEALVQRRDDLIQRLDQARADAIATEEKFEATRKSYTELEAEVQSRTARIEAMSRDLMRRRDEGSRCENEIRIAETVIARLDDNRREFSAELDRSRTLVAGHAERREELAARLQENEAQAKEKRDAHASLQIRHAEAHGKINDLTSAIEKARQELHQTEARLATLQELRASYEGYGQGVREIMKAAGSGDLSGVIGPLAGRIKTRRDYEPALEAALGARVQDIVVESSPAGRGAMDFLAARGLGSATFRPIDRPAADVPGDDLARLLGQPGVIGQASALVERDTAMVGVVGALLGRTVLVQDFGVAEALASGYPGFSFASLDGKILDASGAMTGGSAPSASKLLSREREIDELTISAGTLRTTEEDLRARIVTEREAVESLGTQIQASTGELQALKLERAGLEKDWQTLGRAQEEAATSARRREQQIASVDQEIAAKRALIQEKESQCAEHERCMTELGEEIELARESARAQSEDFRQRGTELAEAHVEVEKVRERLSHLTEAETGVAREIEMLRRDREARGAESDRLRAEEVEAETQIEAIRADLEKLFQKKSELEHGLLNDQAEKDQLALRIKELSYQVEQHSRDERILENDLHERQIRQTEIQTNLNMLSEQAVTSFDRELHQIIEEIATVERDPGELAAEASQFRQQIERIGPVNLAALEEYKEQSERLGFLTAQREDLVSSKGQIEESIATIDETTKRLFHETFEIVRMHFIEMFRRLFNGGKADLIIEQDGPDPLLDGGIEIVAQPPGKKLQTITLMSGGEKAMTAISLLFALFLRKPAPFAILDEIDAPLDDANVERFKHVVAEFAQNTQFIIITHNKQTMALADAIYGVTMEESGVSKLVSVKFEQAHEYATA